MKNADARYLIEEDGNVDTLDYPNRLHRGCSG